MRYLRFRLKSMMILILVSALVIASGVHLARLEPIERGFLDERIALLGLFLILVVAKLVLFATVLGQRGRADRGPKAGPRP